MVHDDEAGGFVPAATGVRVSRCLIVFQAPGKGEDGLVRGEGGTALPDPTVDSRADGLRRFERIADATGVPPT
ncbi:MAG: hypothetical protein D6788_10325 [Planctomycetota bacterium]|nr:MAG: hypothetical protein D6788_10325 [Planctomycetota bacterium]